MQRDERWKMLVIVAAAVGMTVLLLNALNRSDESTKLDEANADLGQALAHSDSLEKLFMRAQFENTTASRQIDSLKGEIRSFQPVIRRVYVIAEVDSTQIESLKSALITRTNQLNDATNERDKAILQANAMKNVAERAIQAYATHITQDSVALLQMKQQADSVAARVRDAEQTTKRRWYGKVWSVTKQIGGKIIPFGLGYGAGKVT